MGSPVAAAQRSSAKSLTYRTKGGVTFEVTADGLSAIRVGDRVLAAGSWRAGSGEGWFKHGTGKVDAGKITARSIEVLAKNHARVRHVQGDITAVFNYTFAGEDVTISAHLDNKNPTDDMTVARFSGLRFDFDEPPKGVMNVQHVSYFQHHGIGLCHPSHWSRIGGSYATDSGVGVGVSPARTGLARTLILWDYASWASGKRAKDPRRHLSYLVVQTVPSRGARTFDMILRVSPNRDWKHLLAPYKEHFRATFGPVRYKADHRWMSSFYANKSMQAVSPANPYGFHDGAARLDLPEGVNAFRDRMLKPIVEGNGQGVILWGQGGQEPRGGMYRPDFDILPPAVETQWAALSAGFEEAGARLGVTTRPRHLAIRVSWKRDGIININPDEKSNREMLWRRFKNMTDKGCTLFYLDSFGTSLEDIKLMRFLRERMGPEIQTFAEHQSDAILPYSGGYSETVFHGDAAGRGGRYNFWSGLRNWEIYRWLAPGSQMISRLFRVQGKIPDGFEPVEKFFYRNHITPLLSYGHATIPFAELKTLQAEYMDEKGRWKEK